MKQTERAYPEESVKDSVSVNPRSTVARSSNQQNPPEEESTRICFPISNPDNDTVPLMMDISFIDTRPSEPQPTDATGQIRTPPKLLALYFMLYYLKTHNRVPRTRCPQDQDPLEHIYECIQALRLQISNDPLPTKASPTPEIFQEYLQILFQKIKVQEILSMTPHVIRPINELLREAGNLCMLVPREIVRLSDQRLVYAIATILNNNAARPLPFSHIGDGYLSSLMHTIHLREWKGAPNVFPTHGPPQARLSSSDHSQLLDARLMTFETSLMSYLKEIMALLRRINRSVSGVDGNEQPPKMVEMELNSMLENIQKREYDAVFPAFESLCTSMRELSFARGMCTECGDPKGNCNC